MCTGQYMNYICLELIMKVWGGRTITQLCQFLFCAVSHNHISIVHVFAAEGAPTGFVNHT